jgi:hypothetical protein
MVLPFIFFGPAAAALLTLIFGGIVAGTVVSSLQREGKLRTSKLVRRGDGSVVTLSDCFKDFSKGPNQDVIFQPGKTGLVCNGFAPLCVDYLVGAGELNPDLEVVRVNDTSIELVASEKTLEDIVMVLKAFA